MFRFPKKIRLPEYNRGDIIKFRWGRLDDYSPRYVIGIVLSCKRKHKDWGDLLAVQINGTTQIHHIWSNTNEFIPLTDGEKMLYKLENS